MPTLVAFALQSMGKWVPLYLDLFLEMDGANLFLEIGTNIGGIYIAVNGKVGTTAF